MKINNRKGFTTVELVIVIAVIAILATALIPTFGGLIDSANKTANEQEVRNIYRDFLAAAPAENASATYYIKVDNAYYLVDEGELSLTPAEDNAKLICGVKYITADSFTLTATSNEAHTELTDGKGTCSTCGTVVE